MKRRPIISTVINNYNYGAYVSRAVESALAQTGAWNEIIVVDDGSTDNSLEILKAYGSRIRIIAQDNHGQASAINAGVAASRGEFIAFLDADDWWYAGRNEAVVDVFARRPDVGLVYHRLRPVRDGRQAFRPIPRRVRSGAIGETLVHSAGRWPFPMTSSITVRRRLWDDAGDIPTELAISADAWLVGVLPFLTKVAGLPRVLGAYRIHANNWYRAHDDAAMLRRRMAHWETTVRLTNVFLAELGLPDRLDLADHFAYQAAAARLGLRTERNGLALFLLGLNDPGEASLSRRVREALSAVLAARRTARRPKIAAEAADPP
ncbi:glycosyltransferase family 2 protein [Acuticoccus kandeliae]|uniref:glycosyltransferase family 2 protein n=1 Tax=Acuticoccus kandeliae TaxID=2073160 RepID=UPI000D3E7126|nr:glycosyltransferase [Acuticoccus kandeliae]